MSKAKRAMRSKAPASPQANVVHLPPIVIPAPRYGLALTRGFDWKSVNVELDGGASINIPVDATTGARLLAFLHRQALRNGEPVPPRHALPVIVEAPAIVRRYTPAGCHIPTLEDLGL